MAKDYCNQNDGVCETCSLTSYGRDCRNQPIESDLLKAIRSVKTQTEIQLVIKDIEKLQKN